MEVLTEAQKELNSYLSATGMTSVERALVIMMLWEEKATIKMLAYIVKTQEKNPAKLYSTACQISEKYKSETNKE